MIKDTNEGNILASWRREETNNSITITSLIDCWRPEAIVGTLAFAA
jgi:hypothetical protein